MLYRIMLLAFISIGLLTSCEKEEVNMNPTPMKKVGELPHKTENLIIVTLDGFRWQEVFKGIDPYLLEHNVDAKNHEEELKEMFWAETEQERREKLMPFLWNTIGKEGQIYGNRDLGNYVNVDNPYWISYPGYHEIFTGYVNYDVRSNSHGSSSDHTVLEFLNKQKGFENEKVGGFTEAFWLVDVFDPERTNLHIEYGAHNERPLAFLYKNLISNEIREHVDGLPYMKRRDWFKYDERVYASGLHYLKEYSPKVLYMSFAETDAYAHQKKYGAYLNVAYNTDVMLQDLWNFIQSDPQYKNKTTLFITVDHGRGIKEEWEAHGASHPHSDETWFAVIGPDTSPQREMQTKVQLYNKQFAATFAAFLGYQVKGVFQLGERIKSVME